MILWYLFFNDMLHSSLHHPPTHKFGIVILIAHALSFILPLSNRFDDNWIYIMNMSHIYILYTLCSKTDIQYYNLKEM